MLWSRVHPHRVLLPLAACFVLLGTRPVLGQVAPVVNTIFPAGGQAGQGVEVTVAGGNLQTLRTLHSNIPELHCERLDAARFRLTIPADTPPGLYDVWGVADSGVSAPRTFAVVTRTEHRETEPNDTPATAAAVPLDVAVHGRIEKAGDADYFRFDGRQGQRVLVECWAERLDSRLRAVLELYDADGRRLAANRGYFGIDPLLDVRLPADGQYTVKVHDLIASGSPEHYYRLDLDTGPRVAFVLPAAIPQGQPARVRLFGWNLPGAQPPTGAAIAPGASRQPLDVLEIDLPASLAQPTAALPVRLDPAQAPLVGRAFPYTLPGSRAPVLIGLTDIPVVLEAGEHGSPATAQPLAIPGEVSGQLVAGDEVDWFSLEVQRGEVLYLEAFGQRLQSPVDLQISIAAAAAPLRELARFGDESRNLGGPFRTDHLDPAGRWVCPAPGRYLVAVRNLTGGLQSDPRRVYRLSIRREEPAFDLVALPPGDAPLALNVRRGGRTLVDILAFRRRGLDGSIRVSATNLPPGVECPPIWLGPGVDRATLVVSAGSQIDPQSLQLQLEGVAEDDPTLRAPVHGGTLVRAGTPGGWGRLTSQIPLAIAGDAPVQITADGHELLTHQLYGKLQVRHAPGGVLDVAVTVDRRDPAHLAPVKLTALGLPEAIPNSTAIIPAGTSKGYLSFFLPPTLTPGRYSLVVRAETTVPAPNQKTETVVVFSNPVSIDVQPAAFLVEVDPFTVTRVRRGEVLKVAYTARRRNGFIGKMHTELASPGLITDVVGLRGRGETFVGQTESGSLQIVINNDAPLGPQPFLRLFTVGVVEDEPVYFGSSLLPLEIID